MGKKTYTVDLCRREYSSARVNVIADSLDDAYILAEAIDQLECDLEYNTNDSEQDDTQIVEEIDLPSDEEEKFASLFLDRNAKPIVKGSLVKYAKDPELSGIYEVIAMGYENSQTIMLLENTNERYDRTLLRYQSSPLELVDPRKSPDLSDKDYWLQHGDCPSCRLGNTVSMVKGKFTCNKCNWEK